ncbi:MAG: hypothetical protein IKG46_06780 [Solobacterium sp.]|nr:hypothetical protein [Solobacterium sp.]
MKQIREFIRLCAELFMEIDSGLILLCIFLVWKKLPVRVIVSVVVIWTTVKWLLDWHVEHLDEELYGSE